MWEYIVIGLLNKITYRGNIKSVSKQRSNSECVGELTHIISREPEKQSYLSHSGIFLAMKYPGDFLTKV